MKKGDKTTPVVTEPDDEINVYNPTHNLAFNFGLFGQNRFFNKLTQDITNFHNNFNQQFAINFENLEKNNFHFQEVKSYSSHIEYKDGKIVKKDEKGVHYVNNNGKGFIKKIESTPDGKNEIKKDFDYRKNNLLQN